MIYFIKIFIVLGATIIAGSYLFHAIVRDPRAITWGKCSLILIGVIAVFGNIWIIYLATAFVCIKLVEQEREDRILAFFALFSALPLLEFWVPFPGINNLIRLDQPTVLAIFLLLPIYIAQRKNKPKTILLDRLVITYCIISTVLGFRYDISVTFWGKSVLQTLLYVWLPYYVVSNSPGNIKNYLIALSFGGIILALGGIAEWFFSWKMYGPLARHTDGIYVSPIATAYYFRGLGLRISTSWFDPIAFGSFMALNLFIVSQIGRLGVKAGWRSYLICACLFAALLFTDSRGAYLVFIVGMMVVVYYWIKPGGMRSFYKYTTLTAVVILFLNLGTLVQHDTSGSWLYRYNLVINSEHAFKANPLLGSPFFRDDPVLRATMLQGQGIVDIVNSYLAVVLRYGLVGFVIYLWIWWEAINGIAKRVSELERRKDPRYEAGIVLLGSVLGMAVFIITTSSFSFLGKLLWLLVALASAYIKNTEIPKKTRTGVSTA
ncbi:O-antigen ligase family protein [Sessilibacter sp. MAH4]